MANKQAAASRIRSVFTWLDRSSPRAWLVAVFFVGLVQRLGLLFFYQAISYHDTPSYRRLADAILQGFAHYDGTRTPGYPLILAIFGSDQSVWLAQMGMGLVVTLLFFYIGWQISGRAWLGGILALAHTLNPGQLFFEPNLLSETATTFWLTLSVAGLVYWIYHIKRRNLWIALGLGLVTSLTWITRPLFIFLPFWILLFLFDKPYFKQISWARPVAYLLPVVLILGGWIGFIHQRFHMWSLTTMTGYNLVQHTGVFFDYVPDEYATLRDTYIKYRDAHIAQYGTQTNTIWEAIPEMQKVSGKSFLDLSRLLTNISIQLILSHPDLFIRNLIQGWWYFWRAPVYWSPDLLLLGSLVPLIKGIVLFERLSLFGLNLVFLLTSLMVVIWRKAREAWSFSTAWWCLLGTVWITSVIQTFLDHGDNPRFLVPVQSIVVFWVFWVVVQTLRSWTTRDEVTQKTGTDLQNLTQPVG